MHELQSSDYPLAKQRGKYELKSNEYIKVLAKQSINQHQVGNRFYGR